MTHKCFHCGDPTQVEVRRIRPPQHRKYICLDTRCWRAWWSLTDRKETSRVA